MGRASLFRWTARWLTGGLLIAGLVAVVLAIVNAVDALPYWLALRRVHQLDQAALQQLAAAASLHERVGPYRSEGAEIPTEFRQLHPLRAVFWPGSSDITLFERGEDTFGHLYFFLRISTNPQNQTIVCVGNGPGGDRVERLWERNPEARRRLNPTDRIVTVWEDHGDSARGWMVCPTKLMIVDLNYGVGQADDIVAEFPLTDERLASIRAGIDVLGVEMRGHVFDSGAMDGIGLRVDFPDSRKHDNIVLRNTWRSELQPLVDAIGDITGKERAINFPNSIERWNRGYSVPPPAVMTLEKYRRVRNAMNLPWWRLWPRVFLSHRDERPSRPSTAHRTPQVGRCRLEPKHKAVLSFPNALKPSPHRPAPRLCSPAPLKPPSRSLDDNQAMIAHV